MNNSQNNALCILTRFYNDEWVLFLKNFSNNYDIYMVIDDNTIIYSNPNPNPNPNIQIIQITDNECRQNNYYNSSVASNLKDIIAWDKALYYFNRLNNKKYDNIWFLEDDVFIWREEILIKMDTTYPTSDLLTSFHEINETGDIYNGWNHWVNVIHRIGTPWGHSLICCSRLSSRLLKQIDNYIIDRPLLFIEALFNTLAIHHNYIIDIPQELSCITYDVKWNETTIIDKNKIYHPLKQMNLHRQIREAMK